MLRVMKLPLVIYNHDDTCELAFDDRSLVYEESSALQYLESMCLMHGSSLQGRIDAFRYITHTSQKSAVMVSEISQDLYFPIISMHAKDCIWIHYNSIVHVSGKTDHTDILFDKGISMNIPASLRTIKLQMKRCEEYLSILHHMKSQYR